MTAREIIEARIGRNLEQIKSVPHDLRRTMSMSMLAKQLIKAKVQP